MFEQEIIEAIKAVCLEQDPDSVVILDCREEGGCLTIRGGIRSEAEIYPEAIARGVAKDAGVDLQEIVDLTYHEHRWQ